MAATRLIPLHNNKGMGMAKTLGARTEYVKNPFKTENGELVTSYACDKDTTAEEFALEHAQYELHARRHYDKEVIAYQIRQSFKPGEITPQEANRIGYETAMRFTKGNHAFIVATHTDRAHIHNHVLFNSVNLKGDGKFQNYFLSSFVLQRVSDLICLENGLSVIKPRPYSEREKRTEYPKYTALRDGVRADMDIALSKKPTSFDDFLNELQKQCYEIKRGKHTAVKGPRQKKFIRFRSLGTGYHEDDIRKKIKGIAVNLDCHAKTGQPQYMDDNFDMLLCLQDIIAKGKGPGYVQWAKKYNVKNVMKAILFFQEKGLRSYKELAERADSSSQKFDELSEKIKSAENKMKEIANLKKHIFNYSRTRDIYVGYRKSGYSKKFFKEHSREIMLHKSAKEAFNKLENKKIPTIKELETAYQEQLSEKKKAYSEYKQARSDMQLYKIAKYDIDQILGISDAPRTQDRQKKRETSL